MQITFIWYVTRTPSFSHRSSLTCYYSHLGLYQKVLGRHTLQPIYERKPVFLIIRTLVSDGLCQRARTKKQSRYDLSVNYVIFGRRSFNAVIIFRCWPSTMQMEISSVLLSRSVCHGIYSFLRIMILIWRVGSTSTTKSAIYLPWRRTFRVGRVIFPFSQPRGTGDGCGLSWVCEFQWSVIGGSC